MKTYFTCGSITLSQLTKDFPMSRANSPAKVLRVALRRVQTRWGKGAWSQKGMDGEFKVCLEGAIFGFCRTAQTEAQEIALKLVQQAAEDLFPRKFSNVPNFNDDVHTTQEDVEKVVKLALIKAECGSLDDYEEIDEEELNTIVRENPS